MHESRTSTYKIGYPSCQKQTKHKKALPTLGTRKMQIKTTELHYCTPTKIAKIKETMYSVDEDMSNWNMTRYCWWEGKLVQ